MIKRLTTLFFLTAFFLPVITNAQNFTENQVALTTPDAPWTIWLDGKNLNLHNQPQIKPDNKSGYFIMVNREEGLTASVFIEPAVNCKTSEECRDYVWKSGNPSWGDVQNVVQSKIGDVSYFEFFRPTVQNRPLQVQDMYAEFVKDGYWVDLHISKVLFKKEDRLLLENLVKSVKFISKTDASNLDSDKSIVAARKSAENWMTLWDSGKYKESYDELIPSTKKVFDEKTWSENRVTPHKSFGKLQSRKIIQFQLIKTLPSFENRSGAIFWYLSSYENQTPVIESFSVGLEKDETWRVANYNLFE